jgi:dTDP-4-dehydrorhamnose reductase
MIKLGRQREVIRVVADQYGCPTNAADLAGAILEVVARQDSGRVICWGTYHYCGRGTASWHQFATAVFENARCYEAFKVKQILPITTAEYPTPAKRPCHSVLDCTKIGRCLDIFPRPWEQSLQTMIGELYRGER